MKSECGNVLELQSRPTSPFLHHPHFHTLTLLCLTHPYHSHHPALAMEGSQEGRVGLVGIVSVQQNDLHTDATDVKKLP